MEKLKELSANLDTMVKTWDKWTHEFIHTFDADFVDINVAQMLDGQTAFESKIGTLRSKKYADYKKAIGSKASPNVDLKDTGDFQSGMYVTDKFDITSKDDKMPQLVNKYGADIFGVQDKKLAKFSVEQIAPSLVDEIKDQLKL